MTKTRVLLLALALAAALTARAEGHVSGGPDTVVVQSGALKLRALLWRPRAAGPSPQSCSIMGAGTPSSGSPRWKPTAQATELPRLSRCSTHAMRLRRPDGPIAKEVDWLAGV